MFRAPFDPIGPALNLQARQDDSAAGPAATDTVGRPAQHGRINLRLNRLRDKQAAAAPQIVTGRFQCQS